MSAELKRNARREARTDALTGVPVQVRCNTNTGVGMLEFLVALLIFSLGMMGLISAQLVSKRAGFEAAQRSVATGLARDMLERMRANPGHIEDYRTADIGDADHRLPIPMTDCDVAGCSAAQLAAFDLWQWEALLLGENEQGRDGSAAGLVVPRACISTNGGHATVAISWRGASTAVDAARSPCAEPGAAPDDTALHAEGVTTQRRQLAISTFIAGV